MTAYRRRLINGLEKVEINLQQYHLYYTGLTSNAPRNFSLVESTNSNIFRKTLICSIATNSCFRTSIECFKGEYYTIFLSTSNERVSHLLFKLGIFKIQGVLLAIPKAKYKPKSNSKHSKRFYYSTCSHRSIFYSYPKYPIRSI